MHIPVFFRIEHGDFFLISLLRDMYTIFFQG